MELLNPAFGLLIWTLLAFLVVFFLLKKFAWPAIINGLKQREQTIADSLATAEKIKLEQKAGEQQMTLSQQLQQQLISQLFSQHVLLSL